jgi:hypothetical protein
MPLPPPPNQHDRHASNPARIMLNSPLAAAMRVRVYHQRTRLRPPERGLRVLAMVGALLVHLLFLFAFVLGPAYPLKPPTPARRQVLQIRLIEPPQSPSPVRGSPPRELGPVHQGSGHRAVVVSERSAHSETPSAVATQALAAVTQPPPQAVLPALKPTRRSASTRAPVAKPKAAPPRATPMPAQPRPALAGQPPTAPKLQPEIARKPQAEGNQPVPPPTSLLMPKLALPTPPIEVPRMALAISAPRKSEPVSVMPALVTPAVPPPAPPSPAMSRQADLIAPVPIPAPAVPQPEPTATPLGKTLLTMAVSSVEPAPAPAPPAPVAPAEKIQAIAAAALPASPPVVKPAAMRPLISAPATVAELAPAAEAPAPEKPGAAPASPGTAAAGTGPEDVSRAPDAMAQGSDTATPGQLNGVVAASSTASPASAAAVPPVRGQGRQQGPGEHLPGAGQTGGNQAGAEHGEQHGAIADYVQLRPQGDTKIMNHRAPNIGYQPTRFEKDWTPENESSVDTVLRRAVEKTTVRHTFHLPQGIRVECAVMPLLPIALLGCHNPDPPPPPVADKVYDRLHMAPANPVATPSPVPNPATTAASAAVTLKLDNSAECAAARVAGGPPPPGCEQPVDLLPAKPLRGPASSSTSWAPASDQFH